MYFRETSTFTVQQAVKETEGYVEGDDFDNDGWEMGGVTAHEGEDGETVFLFRDGTDDDLWDEIFGKKKKKSASSSRAKSTPGVTHIAFVSDMHGRYVTGLKKIRKVDPNAIVYQRIPTVIPLSWAKSIQPYRPKTKIHKQTAWTVDSVVLEEKTFSYREDAPEKAIHLQVDQVLDVNLHDLVKKRGNAFEGIVLSPPWKNARMPIDGITNPNNMSYGIEPEDLSKGLKGLASRSVLPAGFIYIWSPKHLIHRVLKVLETLDFHYVENAICVNQHVRNEFVKEPSRFFSQSKNTLLICRRGSRTKSGKLVWDRVEIRHQRTSDVHFEFCKTDPVTGAQDYAHSYVHNMAETMLPHGRFNPQTCDKEDAPSIPKLLHLWADNVSQRTGWMTVSQAL